MRQSASVTQLLSGLFVLIWATGFIVAGVVSTRAEPLTFLAARYVFCIAVFVLLALGARAAWPRDAKTWRDGIVGGILLHGIYLGGVFWAVSQGLGAGLTALVTGLHPLFTAALALPLLHERLVARQWTGIAVGLGGVALIVAPRMGSVEGVPLHALAAALLATLGFTLGTIWQKRSAPGTDLRVNATIQFVGALMLTAPVAWAIESGRFDHSPALYGALAWAVLGLSVGGISILLVLLKRGAASKVAPLLYLSPPVAAVMALFIFGEAIVPVQVAGMALAVAGAFAARK
jgi:drug/metabolite transporter (DMT)-like permease